MLVGVVNAAKAVNLRHDVVLRESLLECDMLLADGQSVVWAGRVLGRPLPERVAGIDLFEALLELADREGRSIYLLGARPEVLDQPDRDHPRPVAGGRHRRGAARLLRRRPKPRRWPSEIREAAPDMLFLGITSPKKEIFLSRYGDTLGVPILHGVGGSFDVMAGVTQRAPLAWQRAGLEWAYRLKQEPGRLWQRYLRTNSTFIGLVLRRPASPDPGVHPTTELARNSMDEIFSGRVAVIGLGYIGLPTAVVLATRGIDVVGVDVNRRVVEAVERGEVPFVEPDLAVAVKGAVGMGQLKATTETPEADAYIIAVPTPFNDDHTADLGYIRSAVESDRAKAGWWRES